MVSMVLALVSIVLALVSMVLALVSLVLALVPLVVARAGSHSDVNSKQTPSNPGFCMATG